MVLEQGVRIVWSEFGEARSELIMHGFCIRYLLPQYAI